MGHSSIYCGISKLPITSGKMVLIPIVKTNQREGSNYAFTGLPIFGEYSTYLSLENIERTPYVIELEKHFNLTIEQIVENIICLKPNRLSDEDKANDRMLELANLTYFPIDREIWDKVIMEYQIVSREITYDVHSIMRYLGFNETKTDDGIEFTHPSTDKTFVSSSTHIVKNKADGQVVSFRSKIYAWETKITDYIDLPEDKKWVIDGDALDLLKLMDGKSFYKYFTFLLGFTYILPEKPIYDENGVEIDRTKVLIETAKKMHELDFESPTYEEDAEKYMSLMETLLDRPSEENMINIYTKNINNFKHEVFTLLKLDSVMRIYSTPLAPINPYYISQDGELIECNEIIQKISAISSARVAKYKND